ncbi:ubiquinol cytochrome c reductase complex [Echinococcus multilocularis]|uniref:Ubiquinol cytochrome c reductase complex n=1 Tax=Echinococcus multilocularis TaxID=6211 RepID=A0A068YBY5_ECHMU|nr:ubiquinol cytochrome c reductase complex [Echinococcus multilocularis]
MYPLWSKFPYIWRVRPYGIYGGYRTISALPPQSLPQDKPGFFNAIKYQMGHGLRYPTGRLKLSGANMFAICAEYPDLKEFIENLNLPDTFQTWFSLTTLHIWMCLVRLRREGQEARILKKAFIQLIWTDLKGRMRPFGILRKQHDHVEVFNMQFFGSVFAYDEAFLLHSDTALAAAVWRNLFLASSYTSAFHLDSAVHYIRKQLAHLDALSSDQIVGKGMPTFLRLFEDKLDPNYANRRLHYCLTWPEWDKSVTLDVNRVVPERKVKSDKQHIS